MIQSLDQMELLFQAILWRPPKVITGPGLWILKPWRPAWRPMRHPRKLAVGTLQLPIADFPKWPRSYPARSMRWVRDLPKVVIPVMIEDTIVVRKTRLP